jgi:hypothetical protein
MLEISREMENSKHFYIKLFSNAAQKVYPSNTVSDLKIQLAQRIELGRMNIGRQDYANLAALLLKQVRLNLSM